MPDQRAVLIRADSSVDLGTGHVMRCLALAEELRERKFAVTFAIRAAAGDLRDRVSEQGYPCLDPGTDPGAEPERLRTGLGRRADWIVVDHYGRDARWLESARIAARSRLVIDDLGDRQLSAEVLVDGNLDATCAKYEGRVPRSTRLLLGPRYALLRSEFVQARSNVPEVREKVERIVVSMGGSDPANATAMAVAAVRSALPGVWIDVILGLANMNAIRPADRRLAVHRDVRSMSDLLLGADLAVGAAGTSALERCAIGLPMVNLRLADNQDGVASAMAEAGLAVDAGRYPHIDARELERAVASLAENHDLRSRMRSAGMQAVDGLGVRRVAGIVDGVRLRRARWSDRRRLWEWANDPHTRMNSLAPEPIPFVTHEDWLRRRLADPTCELLVGQSGRGPIGQMRLDRYRDRGEVSISVAPEHRGGTGRLLLEAGLSRWARRHPGLRLVARIKDGNTPSQRMFERCGFQLIDETSGVLTYELPRAALGDPVARFPQGTGSRLQE